jgi:RNA polymerase sigma-70 factor (ECF subfamily)
MPETINEIELVDKLRQGDTNAFKVLYEKYAPRLKAFSFRFNFTVEESEDIVQETFIKIWENRLTIIPKYSFNTFLITIAKHLIYNQLRHSVYKKNYSKEVLNVSSLHLTPGNEKDLQILIERSIKRLPDKCRQVYQKSRMEGYSNSEIATELNISKSTVENHLNKALKMLKQNMLSAGYGTSHAFLLLLWLYRN